MQGSYITSKARAVALSTVASLGLAIAPTAQAIDICHAHPSGVFIQMSLNGNAWANAHSNHATDHLQGTFYADLDGDGYGDPNGATSVCNDVGFAENADDCDDTDAAVNPGIPGSCDVDCGCVTMAQLDAAYADHLARVQPLYPESYVGCHVGDDGYGADYAYITARSYDYDPQSGDLDVEGYLFYWTGFHAPESHQCDQQYIDFIYEGSPPSFPEFNSTIYPTLFVDHAQHEACRQLVLDWATGEGLTCTTGAAQ